MGMIPEVKCRRCGETFSAMRSRCPNCGTRRVTQSSRTPGATPGTVRGTAAYERAETNTKWQMIFGLILVVAVILAAVVMVTTSLSGIDGQTPGKASIPTPTENVTPEIPEAPTPTPTMTPTIETVDILYLGLTDRKLGDDNKVQGADSPTMRVGDEPLHLVPSIYPMTVSVSPSEYHWSSSDTDCLEVTVNPEDGSCDVSCVGAKGGGVLITVEVYGVSNSCRIYTREADN